ncbi:glycosyltransferase family 2 protein [Herbaspirillum chlorophenolicum]|uniref:Glycosyltransferase family 2 protein n=1 Tax=Herbaspirillum chlorophenolicum TaxID=211589 RepID=A0ABW8EUI8_9BURK
MEMNFAVQLILLLGLSLLAIPVCVLLVQAMAAIIAQHHATRLRVQRPRIAVLMPAHNEAGGIVEVITSVRAQLEPGDRLLVVADNCSDNTAELARRAGAQVTERFHDQKRGKGYALDHGMAHLAADVPEVVIIVDADCIPEAGALDMVARAAAHSGRPVQALYLMYSPAGAGPMRKIAEFAWLVKNLVRPLGFQHLGLPCQLMGTGMAFPWKLISKAELATGHIVEDMKLGVDLAREGRAPLFCPEALVYSYFPSSEAGSRTQRTRWEHGHMSVILTQVPRLLAAGVGAGNGALLGLALDLCVPPLALLVLLCAGALAVSLLAWAVFSLWAPAFVAALLVLAIGVSIVAAWMQYGRKVISFGELMMAALYVLGKLPLYLKFLVNRQVEWVRSKRDTE